MVKKILKSIIILDVIILHILIFYISYQYYFNSSQINNIDKEDIEIVDATTIQETIGTTSCPSDCVNMIESLEPGVTEENISIPTPTSRTVNAPAAATQKVKSTSYLPISGSGSTLNAVWTDLEGTDFYMSTSDYPGLLGVYFEANIKLLNGNGEAYVRIYDVTNSRGVDNSTLKTSSQTSVFASDGPISLWSGFNHYIIQVKSLTADTAYFESGRLKIITEN